MDIERTIADGDKSQIKALRFLYNELLEQKDSFLDQAKRKPMNAHQAAEVELTLARITGRMKELDNKIYWLVFGYEEWTGYEASTKKAQWYLEKEHTFSFKAIASELNITKEKNKSLNYSNASLRSYIELLKIKLLKHGSTEIPSLTQHTEAHPQDGREQK